MAGALREPRRRLTDLGREGFEIEGLGKRLDHSTTSTATAQVRGQASERANVSSHEDKGVPLGDLWPRGNML